MTNPGYAYIWEYRVRPESVAEFEKAYGAEGDWVRLFSKADGYLRTELHRDRADPLRFVTIDYWRSARDWESFRQDLSREFEAIDAACEQLTVSEREIGRFDPT